MRIRPWCGSFCGFTKSGNDRERQPHARMQANTKPVEVGAEANSQKTHAKKTNETKAGPLPLTQPTIPLKPEFNR